MTPADIGAVACGAKPRRQPMLIDTAPARTGSTSPEAAMASLVDAIGDDSFGPALANYLHVLCGADHFAAFHLGADNLRQVAACCVQPDQTAVEQVSSYVEQGLWKRDPAMDEARRCIDRSDSALVHIALDDEGYSELRSRQFAHIRDRMVLCARIRTGAFGLSVLRADPHSPFDDTAGQKLGEKADLLAALLSKHAEVTRGRPDVAHALTRLPDIENCLATMCELPRREAEVCSRVLYGMSSVGISLDLEISEETVKTYRKRAYQRLHIGSERELLNWYLGCWGRWHSPSPRLAASH